MNAVIKAQSQAAMTTVQFVNDVGFFSENRSAITVDFSYIGVDDNGTTTKKRITVPFLVMLPIPNLEVSRLRALHVVAAVGCHAPGTIVMMWRARVRTQIEEVSILFNAKISSVTTAESSASSASSSGYGGSYGWGYWGGNVGVSYSGNYASKSQSANSNEEKREFSIEVEVSAKQASIPEGLSRLLQILADAIRAEDSFAE